MSLAIQAILASFATLLGGWLVVRFLQGRASTMRLISGVAAGYLLSAALVRIIPESFEMAGGGDVMAFWVLGGFMLVHVMEHGITTHFHYGEETHHDGGPMAGIMALVGLSMHSFMDGLALAAAAHSGRNLGLFMFTALMLHRIPEGATISSIFLMRGFGNRGALMAAAGLAGATLLGAFSQSALHLSPAPVLALSGGLVIYVASSDLLPEAQRESGWKSTLALLAGFGLFMLTSFIAPHRHGG